MSNVKENYLNISSTLSDNAVLIAVSKTKPVEMIMDAYEAGCRDFGENYVQELVDKIPVTPEDIRWHMIGHLQTNKVKYIVGKVFLIHSVDSLKLAKEISKEAVKHNIVQKILVEINVAGEDSKFGSSDFDQNLEMVKQISELEGVELCGFMTIAPFTKDPESNREYFKALKKFSENEASLFVKNPPILSMGMSGDYKVALEEGATYIRIGTNIFGERDYGKN